MFSGFSTSNLFIAVFFAEDNDSRSHDPSGISVWNHQVSQLAAGQEFHLCVNVHLQKILVK